MESKQNFSKVEAVPIHVLPDLPFDLSDGKPLPQGLGTTDVPVVVLPELAFDLQAVPVLQVTVRPEATPVQIGYDLYRLYLALNQLDLSLSGNGLLPDEDTPRKTTNGSCTLTFKPNRPEGAAQRFVQMAKLINAANQTTAWPPHPMPAITGCKAATAV
jgi:hypothetical protein